MEESSISMIVELLQLTSKFFNDAAEIVNQRRVNSSDHSKSSKKRRKIKTKRHKSGYQVFLKEKMSELKKNPEYSNSKMSTLSSLVSQEWNKAGEQEKEIYKQKAEKLKQEEVEKVNCEERKFEPSESLLKLLEDNDTIEESSSENEKGVKKEAIKSPSESEDQLMEEESD
ncbi:unnamed protein product [Blepharisma stoltei]|uniref:HMG box domain-containing protein n=1 Tax=Blepharisma stoltei TaxID=1481888 RepID=A0AAU9JZN2_9CILI|nr:unnamed protein product [Blepharisma stoltei]